jgi:hypothetical protein
MLSSLRTHRVRSAVILVAAVGAGVLATQHGQLLPQHGPAPHAAHRAAAVTATPAQTATADEDPAAWVTGDDGTMVNQETGDVYDPQTGVLHLVAADQYYDSATDTLSDEPPADDDEPPADDDPPEADDTPAPVPTVDEPEPPAPDPGYDHGDGVEICAGNLKCNPDTLLPNYQDGGGLKFDTP